MRRLLLMVCCAATLHSPPTVQAQSSDERAALTAVFGALIPPSSRGRPVVIEMPTECLPDFIGFANEVDCDAGKLTASGQLRAAAASKQFASAVRLQVAKSAVQEIRALRTPPRNVRAHPCKGQTEFVAVVVPGPLVEVERGARWRVTMMMFTYPKLFECEGGGSIMEFEAARVGGEIRITSSAVKRHCSGAQMRP